MRKVHLRANKLTGNNAAKAVCAMSPGASNLKTNKRATYACMSSDIVGFDEYKTTDSAKRCAHCDAAIPAYNIKRAALGLRVWDMSGAA